MTTDQNPFAGFGGVVRTFEEIRELIGVPPPPVIAKVMDPIDELSKQIKREVTVYRTGRSQYSGLSRSLTERRPGGLRAGARHEVSGDPRSSRQSARGYLQEPAREPYLSVLFLIPGHGETLRVTGECRIVRDEALRESLAVGGQIPDLAIVLHVERVLIHWPKCMVRSKLWQPATWVDSADTADIVEAMIANAKLDATPEDLKAQMERAGVTRLY